VEKSPDAFRTISEVAQEIGVPQHVLRFWETRFTHIRPMKRGGGRRYYRPDDVDLLRGVRHLLYGEGYTIRGVQRILREEGTAFVQNVWRAGAEQPPPPSAEDGLEEELVEVTADARAEPDLSAFDFPPSRGKPAAAPGPSAAERRESGVASPASASPAVATPPVPAVAAVPQPRGLAIEERKKLQAALDDLVECRRLIEAALLDNAAGQIGRAGEL
jgi:DNA-binding transcriptional MerR regulator